MTPHAPSRWRVAVLCILGTGLALATLGGIVLLAGTGPRPSMVASTSPTDPVATTSPVAPTASVPFLEPTPTPPPVAGDPSPLRVRIPGIEVDAPVISLGVDPVDNTLQVPTDFSETGWWPGRAAPGEVGPSIVVGHVDSTSGPAVFARLDELQAGDIVEIDRADGVVARFEVTEVVEVDKDDFPTDRVYSPTEGPTLRLITCGGVFDNDASTYESNVIIFADHLGNQDPGSGDLVT